MENLSIHELQNAYRVLSRVQKSLVAANEMNMQVMDKLRKDNEFCREQLTNADKMVQIQKKITIDHIVQSKEVHDGLVKEILELKAELKVLRGK